VVPLSEGRFGQLFFKRGKTDQSNLGAFKIDTGASGYVSLEESLFDELVKSDEIQYLLSSEVLDAKGKHASQRGELTTFQLGGHTFKRIPVSRSGGNSVGIHFLSMFDVYLDFASSQIALKPNERFGRPIPKGRIGIGIEKVNGKVVVGTVRAGSVSEKLAVQIGSVVISVDGTDVRDMELFRIRRMMRKKVGDTLDLVLEQDGKRIRKSLIAVRRGSTESSLADVQDDEVIRTP